jgi:hypothetical protein
MNDQQCKQCEAWTACKRHAQVLLPCTVLWRVVRVPPAERSNAYTVPTCSSSPERRGTRNKNGVLDRRSNARLQGHWGSLRVETISSRDLDQPCDWSTLYTGY